MQFAPYLKCRKTCGEYRMTQIRIQSLGQHQTLRLDYA